MIQAQLRRIGVQAQVRQVDFSVMGHLLDKGNFDASILGSTMDTGLDLTQQFHSPPRGSENLTHYANPQVDRLIDDSMRQPDIAKALPDLIEIQRILHREQPYTYLWESQRVNANSRRLHDVRSNMLYALFHLDDWWLDSAATANAADAPTGAKAEKAPPVPRAPNAEDRPAAPAAPHAQHP